MTEIYLADLIYDGENVCAWPFIATVGGGERVYYSVNEGGDNGFRFYAVENTGRLMSNGGDLLAEWTPSHTHAECLFHGCGYFDGVRHLYMGDEKTENEGYQFYPDFKVLSEVLGILRDLEIKYCRDVND